MPIKKGKSKKVISSNIDELMTGPVGKAREKGIRTMMMRNGMTYEEARQKMAVAIAYSKAKKSKKKKIKKDKKKNKKVVKKSKYSPQVMKALGQ